MADSYCGFVRTLPADHPHTVYHDTEYGFPLHGDAALLERLSLEIAQAGLSWLTILKKQAGYRRAFDGFDLDAVAAYGDDDVARLLADPGIVRNRAKIESSVRSARAYLDIGEKQGFSTYLWDFVDGRPVQNSFRHTGEVPAETEISKRISKDLKARGFNFVGPTIVYAFMQAVGMVNDHLVDCYRHAACAALTKSPLRIETPPPRKRGEGRGDCR